MIQRVRAPLLGGAIGALVFALSLGLQLVDPREVAWVMRGDWLQHFMGWHFYRSGPWTWPIGAVPLLGHPIGTSIALTDAIPIFAVVFKPLHALLPPAAQYLGLWLLGCYVLQGVFGVLLMRLATPLLSLQLLGAALFVLCPPFVTRVGHPALTAHWLLLASLWWSFRRWPAVLPWSFLFGWLAIAGVAAATHPYVAFMVLMLMGAAYGRQMLARPANSGRALVQMGVLGAWIGTILWQAGYFVVGGAGDLQSTGVGHYSMNLLAVIMPDERSLMPAWLAPATNGQYEGFMYLGAGLLGVCGVALVSWLRMLPRRRFDRGAVVHLPFVLACALLTVLALSPVVTAGPVVLFTYNEDWLGPLTVFRASGRLFWPVFYALVWAAIAVVAAWRPTVARAVLGAAVALQTADLTDRLRDHRELRDFEWVSPLTHPLWTAAPPHYQRLSLLPTNLCHERPLEFDVFGEMAGRHGLAINSGAAARYDAVRVTAYCRELADDLQRGLVDEATLYVVSPEVLPAFVRTAGPRAACASVDRWAVCFAPHTYAAWQDEIDITGDVLPPPHDFANAHADLEEEYARMGRSPAPMAGGVDERVAALRQYFVFRVTGCDHPQATEKVRRIVRGDAELRVCDNPLAPRHSLPGDADTAAFRRALETWLRDLGRPVVPTRIDLEGEAVWLRAYAQARLDGRSDEGAQDAVRAAIRDLLAARPPEPRVVR